MELLALHRAIMEAKFTPVPNDPVVPGSSLIADIANRVVDVLDEMETANPHPAMQQFSNMVLPPTWAEWRKLDTRRQEWHISLERVSREGSWWLQQSLDEKKVYARILLSPFVLDDNLLDDFIALADSMASTD